MISRDAGQTWTAMNQGLEILAVACLGFAGDNGEQLIAGTSGRGGFVWPFASGIAEGERRHATSHKPQATILRGVLEMPPAASHKPQGAKLLDASGRSVLDLHSGPNDVSRLAPGIYFVHSASGAGHTAPSVAKLVVTR
jgi:hypothetical protein